MWGREARAQEGAAGAQEGVTRVGIETVAADSGTAAVAAVEVVRGVTVTDI